MRSIKEVLAQTGYNALSLAVLPAIYAVIGYAMQTKWPQSDHSTYWLIGGIIAGALYIAGVGLTFAIGIYESMTSPNPPPQTSNLRPGCWHAPQPGRIPKTLTTAQ